MSSSMGGRILVYPLPFLERTFNAIPRYQLAAEPRFHQSPTAMGKSRKPALIPVHATRRGNTVSYCQPGFGVAITGRHSSALKKVSAGCASFPPPKDIRVSCDGVIKI